MDLRAQLESALAGGYLIERELGRGGMATVYLARDLRDDRLVALKVLRPEVSGVLGAERFGREIAIAARLSHPHILPIIDSGALELGLGPPVLFYTMPHIAGRSLRELLREEPQLPIDKGVRIARQVAAALDHAHGQGVIHRDIKPENILLADGEALVADFGLARALDVEGAERLTETGIVLGTPAYMSPEQGEGSTHIDGRSDIYALGCVLYEMLAGQPPFTGPTAQAILARHAMDPVPSLRTVRSTVGPALGEVVVRALAKVPADRFATAQAFSAALAVPEQSPIPETLAVVAPQGSTAWRQRVLAAAAVATVGILAIVLAVAARSRNREPAKVDPALVVIAPFRVASADSSLGYLREGMVDLLAAKFSGEDGLRAAEPRSMLSAWRRIAGSKEREVAPDAAMQLARTVGAGRAIDGSVVGTADQLTLTASMLTWPGGGTVARASVEGPADSLPALVDRLASRLLTLGAGVDASRLAATSAFLPAIRAFLAGRAAFRKGRLDEAFRHFRDATLLDSTFALAAFEMVHASRWVDGGEDAERGMRLAQAGRDRLSPADRVLLDAWAGPYPTGPEYLARWQAVAKAYPDRAESWYWLGDAYYHNARLMGVADPFGLAEQAFLKGWVLDSASGTDSLGAEHSPIFAEPLDHMMAIAQMKGDTATVRRLAVLGLTADSTSGGAWYLRWHRALALGDSALRAFWADSLTIDPWAFGQISQFITATGIGSQDLARATRLDTRNVEGGHPGVVASSHALSLLNGGRPHEALRVLHADDTSTDGLIGRLREALFWEGDTSEAGATARRLASLSAGAPRPGSAGREQVRGLCTVAMWRASHNEYGETPVAIGRLRAGGFTQFSTDDSLRTAQYTTTCIALLDAMLSTALRHPDARAKLSAADEAARNNILLYGLGANLIVARLAETQGDTALALRAVRRRAGDFADFPFYLTTFLREEGRLAALMGDTAGAIRAYQHYLRLRPDPEPAVAPGVARVREELAKLAQEPGR